MTIFTSKIANRPGSFLSDIYDQDHFRDFYQVHSLGNNEWRYKSLAAQRLPGFNRADLRRPRFFCWSETTSHCRTGTTVRRVILAFPIVVQVRPPFVPNLGGGWGGLGGGRGSGRGIGGGERGGGNPRNFPPPPTPPAIEDLWARRTLSGRSRDITSRRLARWILSTPMRSLPMKAIVRNNSIN